jgi:AraC-like DNA-binding protein
MQFLIEYRIEQAGRMLKDTTKSVLEISLDCGFENVSYFIRQFKRHKNMTPRQYRQSMKKGDK